MLVRLAWRNLWRGWRRSAVVLAAIAVGLAATLLVVSWSRGMLAQMGDNAVQTYLAHVAVHVAGYRDDPEVAKALPDGGREVLEAAEDLEGVHAAPRLVADGLVQSARASLRAVVIGIDPVREPQVSIIAASLVEGEYLRVGEEARGTRRLPPIVVGEGMVERLRLRLGDKLVVHVPGETGLGAFRIRGIYRTMSSEFDKTFAFVPLPQAQRLLGAPGGATEVAVLLDRPSRAPAVRDELARRLAAHDPAVEVLTWRQREPRLASMLDLASSTYWIFYGVIFVAMAFGIANALLMSVFERTREFGVLRSLGLGSRRLVALVLCESLLLTMAGVLLGVALGVPLVLWLGRVGIDLAMFAEGLRAFGVGAIMYPRLGIEDLSSPIALAALTAILAGLWPAIKVALLKPAEALRRT